VKIGILGGSFNPIHLGHLFIAGRVFSELKLDRIIFIPAYRSPFKPQAMTPSCSLTPCANDRINMLAAAITGDSRFTIDNCEIRREGISYTVDTLEDIISRFLPEGKPSLIIGDDLAGDFPKWHDSKKILELADVVVVRRNNTVTVDYPFPHISVENEVMTVSSHEIRQKISEGDDWRSLVPSGVRAIIEDKRFYGYQSPRYKAQEESEEDYSWQNIQRIEAAMRETLSTERFLHSRHTALHASDMCRRFGLNPQAGYLAGIAHDLAKQYDNKQLLKIVKSDGQEISALEKDKPNLLHGKAAAVLLRERFCINNRDILEAVAFHTSGSANMGALAKIVYIADKTESSRTIDPALRKMFSEDSGHTLDDILYAVLEKTICKLRAKDLDLSKDTLLLLEKIKGK
jgi:nicotinate-nucleotide adenylyltransferase